MVSWPVAHYGDKFTQSLIFSKLGDLARKGILTAPTPSFWNSLRAKGIGGRRMDVKQGTAHNDKLGFDWSVPDGMFIASADMTSHPMSSAYKGFTAEFLALVQELDGTGNAQVIKQHAETAASAFSLDERGFTAKLNSNEQVAVTIPQGNAYPIEKV